MTTEIELIQEALKMKLLIDDYCHKSGFERFKRDDSCSCCFLDGMCTDLDKVN